MKIIKIIKIIGFIFLLIVSKNVVLLNNMKARQVEEKRIATIEKTKVVVFDSSKSSHLSLVKGNHKKKVKVTNMNEKSFIEIETQIAILAEKHYVGSGEEDNVTELGRFMSSASKNLLFSQNVKV